jgi:hypothetical protein
MPRKTERECYHCEDGMMLRDDHDLWCDTCYFAPSVGVDDERPTPLSAHRWDWHWQTDPDGRKRCVGGYRQTYYGDGAYEFGADGFSIS